jgi:hypoxanthine phosphoribosyltransferase
MKRGQSRRRNVKGAAWKPEGATERVERGTPTGPHPGRAPPRVEDPRARPERAGHPRRVPRYWRDEVERVLLTGRQLQTRVRQLARAIERDYRGRDLVLVPLLTGTVMFLADLMRHLSLPLRLDFVGVSSYGAGTESGRLVFTKKLQVEVRGRDVLVVDDILDTGKTLRRVTRELERLEPRSIRTCVLLDKKARRTERIEADYAGFEIPDAFVVGYGLDYAERYRNLPFVGVLKAEVYQPPRMRVGRSVSWPER